MEISKYSRIYEIDDGYILFNTINKSVVKMDSQYIEKDRIVDNCPNDYINLLSDMGYFMKDEDAENYIHELLKKDKKLIISVEIGLACNMRCPYCYQGTDKVNKSKLSDDDINYLLKYYKRVSDIWNYDEIVLKVLGGEPTVMWHLAKKVITMTSKFCRENNKKLSLMIDTNGVNIDPILELEDYDSLILTIPLTNKKCPDKVRKLVNGGGSYDEIVSNLNRIYEANPNIKIVLRHNTDDENLPLFSEYIDDLKSKLAFPPVIDISYTTELGDGGYKNLLQYEEYIKWKSGDSIDILAERNISIIASPLMSYDRCQYRSRYSLKVFSDGTVGGCAIDFFKKDRKTLKELCCNLNCLDEQCDLFDKEYMKCKQCKSFFLCGGGYNLPCIKRLPIKECDDDGAYIIYIEKFIKKYVYYKAHNKDNLFVGFNQNMIIR